MIFRNVPTLATLLLAFLAHSAMADTLDERLDELLAGFDESTPGAVIGLVKDGELVHVRASGMADLRFAVPFETDTLTNIGSTAKQFTGMALALLHERGELSLDDDVRDHLPELPDFGHTVTLRHLASHTSGYREFLNTLAIAGVRVEKGDWIETDDAVDTVLHQPELQNVPGEERNYNNTGYVLIARVVSRVTGKPFHEWAKTEIFEPLGMDDTRYRLTPGQVLAGASTGYTPGPDGEGHVEARDVGGSLGAGGLYTTAADMARWMGQLGDFELGGEAVRELMTIPFELNDGEATGYGLGLVIDEWRGQVRWQQGGSDAGHSSIFHFYPELDRGVMVFANHHAIDGELVTALTEAFLGEFLNEPAETEAAEGTANVPASPDEEFADAMFDRYAGRYELEAAPGFVMRVFRDGERYMTQATGQQAIEITPVSSNMFELEGVAARLEFHAEEDGRVGELTLHQNGQHRAQRLEDEDKDEAIDLSPFVGRNFSPELETVYTVEIEDDALRLVHRRLDPIALHHAEGDQFGGGFPVARVDFLRDENGTVTGMHLGNGRARDIHFERMD